MNAIEMNVNVPNKPIDLTGKAGTLLHYCVRRLNLIHLSSYHGFSCWSLAPLGRRRYHNIYDRDY